MITQVKEDLGEWRVYNGHVYGIIEDTTIEGIYNWLDIDSINNYCELVLISSGYVIPENHWTYWSKGCTILTYIKDRCGIYTDNNKYIEKTR